MENISFYFFNTAEAYVAFLDTLPGHFQWFLPRPKVSVGENENWNLLF